MRPQALFLLVLVLTACSGCGKRAETPTSRNKPVETTGIAGQIEELASRIGQRRSALPKRLVPPGSLPRAAESLEEAYLALAQLQIEKARDYLQLPEDDLAADAIRSARTLLAAENPQEVPRKAIGGLLTEHAYFADNDSSAQPYFVYAPSVAAAGRKLPLIILLHGWIPETSRINPWLISDDVVRLAEEYGTFLVMPHGRTNTDFQYAGERDVLRVLAEMRKFHDIDPDRVYLVGCSMGGAGAWQIGMHYPDLFAAVAPINAQGDWFKFWHEQFSYPERKALPHFIQHLLGAHNPTDLAPNLSSLYSYSQHATLCFLGAAHTKGVVRRLQAFGAPHDFFEDPSELGHHIYFETDCWRRAFERILRQRRQRNPRKVRYITSSLRFPGSYWLRIRRFMKWGSPAIIEAVASDGGNVIVSSRNVASLVLSPPSKWADEDGVFRVVWNRKSFSKKPDAEGRIILDRPDEEVAVSAVAKTTAVCGPASDVFNFPFIVVRGVSGNAEDNAASESLAEEFADAWYDYAEGRVAVVRDTEVTKEMIQSKNLVLVGPPECNSITARITNSLPFKISRDSIVLPRGKTFAGRNVGLALTYPNPLRPDRYVLIMQGAMWGKHRARNHRFDLLPDFAVFGSEPIPEININRFYAAGFFDEYWRYSPKLTDFWP